MKIAYYELLKQGMGKGRVWLWHCLLVENSEVHSSLLAEQAELK